MRRLTLDEAVAIACEQHHDIAKAKQYEKKAQGIYMAERSAALPQLALGSSATASRDRSQTALTGIASTVEGYGVDVTVSQPLYTWGKVSAAIRAAQKGLATADEQMRLARQAVHREVALTFYNVLLAKELLHLAQEDLAQKERHLIAAKSRHKAGVATDYDTLAARVSRDNSRPAVIRAEHALRVNREQFRLAIGDGGREVDAAGNLETDFAVSPSFEESFNMARQRRPQLVDIQHRKGVADELVTIARADSLPRIDLKGGSGWRSLEAGNQSSEGTAWNVGVFFSFPFLTG